MEIRKVAMLGLGAVGAIYFNRLNNVLDDCVAIADGKRLEHYRSAGTLINGERHMFDYRAPSELSEADLCILACKNTQLDEAIDMISPCIGEHTAILSLLNGISSEKKLSARFGSSHVLYGFALGISSEKGDCRIDFTSEGKIVFGEADNSISERVAAIKDLFDRAGINYLVPENIKHDQYKKFTLNTAFNTVSAICRAGYGFFENEDLKSLIYEISHEVQRTVLESDGVVITDRDIDDNLEAMLRLDRYGKTSMFQDIEAKRPTENDYLAGEVVRMAKEVGRSVPVTETVWKLVRGIELCW